MWLNQNFHRTFLYHFKQRINYQELGFKLQCEFYVERQSLCHIKFSSKFLSPNQVLQKGAKVGKKF